MYVTAISIPLAFHAADDAEANLIAHRIAAFYAGLAFDPTLRERFSAEVTDMPQPLELSEMLPYEPQREVKLDGFAALEDNA